jgi:SMC interacting uncharacterized protein involved in chromosome segregation
MGFKPMLLFYPGQSVSQSIFHCPLCFQISQLITKCSELKNSNIALGKKLEEADDQIEALDTQNTDLHNQIENQQVSTHYKQNKIIIEVENLIRY